MVRVVLVGDLAEDGVERFDGERKLRSMEVSLCTPGMTRFI